MPSSRIAVTECGVGGWPSTAPRPADSTRNSPRPAAGPAEQRLGHRAATDIAGADEQNGFHPAQRFKVNSESPIVNPKSRTCLAHDCESLDQIHRPRQHRIAHHRLWRRGSMRWRRIIIGVVVRIIHPHRTLVPKSCRRHIEGFPVFLSLPHQIRLAGMVHIGQETVGDCLVSRRYFASGFRRDYPKRRAPGRHSRPR